MSRVRNIAVRRDLLYRKIKMEPLGIFLFPLALLLVFIIAVALDGGNNQRDNT